MGVVAFSEESMDQNAKNIDEQLAEYKATLAKVQELSDAIPEAIGGNFAAAFQANYDNEQKEKLKTTENFVDGMNTEIMMKTQKGVNLAEDALERMKNTRQVM